MSPTITFRSKLWLYPSENAAWHFITLPKPLAKKVKSQFGHEARGWGSLPVAVTIGSSQWRTSIFPDKKSDSYVLPIKAAVRKKEEIAAGDTVSCEIRVRI